jgi:hypothetical protein
MAKSQMLKIIYGSATSALKTIISYIFQVTFRLGEMSRVLKSFSHWTTSIKHRLFWDANSCSVSQEIPTFHGTQRVITVFITDPLVPILWPQ